MRIWRSLGRRLRACACSSRQRVTPLDSQSMIYRHTVFISCRFLITHVFEAIMFILGLKTRARPGGKTNDVVGGEKETFGAGIIAGTLPPDENDFDLMEF